MTPRTAATLGDEIIRFCTAPPPSGLGFATAGISDSAPTRWGDELVSWLEADRHSSMGYLKNQLAARLNPNLVLQGARSAVMVADLYASRGDRDPAPAGGHGRIARYARGRDYHKVIRRRLHQLADMLRERYPGEQFRSFVDTAPVLEREYAARAGLGWVGKHTLLIHPRLGSYTLLGGILTTLELQPPSHQPAVDDHCGTCTRCIDACPTQAISPYSVDASRCISYLTIERRPPIPPEFHQRIGEWLYGCDVCQEVCPHNSARSEEFDAGKVHPDYRPRQRSLPLLDVLAWAPDDRARVLDGSAMKRATLAMMKRNALIVLGNIPATGDHRALHERLAAISADENEAEMVRQTAEQTLHRLREESPAPSFAWNGAGRSTIRSSTPEPARARDLYSPSTEASHALPHDL